jgi:OPA family glycerol-3-phosphate transporter-like MFS transporter
MNALTPLLATLAEGGETMFQKFLPILILLIVVAVVISRLPRADLGTHVHSQAFRIRRITNWLPLGLTYAFLYMGRYNIKVSQHFFGDMMMADGTPLMTNAGFAQIFFWGTLTYGFSFLINGPITDRIGGKRAILIGAAGAVLANIALGLVTWVLVNQPDGELARSIAPHLAGIFSALYAANMYFQSYGAVAIVKCNAPWFHVRERGVFGAIFGILISLGIYFAFDWGYMIAEVSLPWLFFTPAAILTVFWIIDLAWVKDSPALAGLEDFHTADASAGDDGPQLSAIAVFKRMFTNPIIMTIACVEFCSGFMRQAIMQWFRTFAKQTDATLHLKGTWVYDHWGMLLCSAGILGGVFAGTISDHIFKSRRGPVAAVLYGLMLVSAIILAFTFKTNLTVFGVHIAVIEMLVIFMSMCVIGVHGMLSGTASMDFGGARNVGIAAGIIDGFVYAGTAFMAILYEYILPSDVADPVTGVIASADPDNWRIWPVSMIPVALVGLFLAMRVWGATPERRATPEPAD